MPGVIRVNLSDQVGRISVLVSSGGKTASGVPVFLWPADPDVRRSLGGPREALCDTEGRARFDDLPPGDYRLLATFDAGEIDEELLELSRAPAVRVTASQTAAVDLTVWTAPW